MRLRHIFTVAWLLSAAPALADHQALYRQALDGIERNLPRVSGYRPEQARLERLLEPLIFAYAWLHPQMPEVRVRPVLSGLERGVAWSMDSGLILVNPYLTAQLGDAVVTGVLAHEMGHIALEHGWARTRMALESVSGTTLARMTMAMTGQHPLKGTPAWSELRHGQEYQADAEARRLLVEAGLPPAWVNDAIQGVGGEWGGESHPSGYRRLAALAAEE